MSKPTVQVAFDLDELVEIEAAIMTKINYVDTGRFGAEEKPGEDRRWMDDLKAIQKKVQDAIAKSEGGKKP